MAATEIEQLRKNLTSSENMVLTLRKYIMETDNEHSVEIEQLRAERDERLQMKLAEVEERKMSDQKLARAYDKAMEDIVRLEAEIERLRQLVKTLTEADPRHDLANKIERLQAELSRWHLDVPACANVLLSEENDALIAENEQLKEELERLNDLIFRQRAALQLIGGMIESRMKHGEVFDFIAAAQMIERILNNRAENDGPK